MSQETIEFLNKSFLTGYDRKPWHYTEGVSTPPFAGPVPEEAAKLHLPEIVTVQEGFRTEDVITMDGVTPGEWHVDPDRIRLLAADNNQSLGVHSVNYGVHQYADTLLGMGLPIATVGLLKGRRLAVVQYGTADTVLTKDNIGFETKLVLATSTDGSAATCGFYASTLVVCDNTFRMAQREGKETTQRVRHTRFSMPRVDEMREAFGRLGDVAADVADDITADVRWDVTDKQVDKFLDKMFAAAKDPEASGRAATIAENARASFNNWYGNQFSDYQNTAFGVIQAFDSAVRWNGTTRGMTNAERDGINLITGKSNNAADAARKVLQNV